MVIEHWIISKIHDTKFITKQDATWKKSLVTLVMIYPVLSNGILELWNGGFRTRQCVQHTQRQNKRRMKGHVHGTCSWRQKKSKERGTGIYRRRFLGIMREMQLGITGDFHAFSKVSHQWKIRKWCQKLLHSTHVKIEYKDLNYFMIVFILWEKMTCLEIFNTHYILNL